MSGSRSIMLLVVCLLVPLAGAGTLKTDLQSALDRLDEGTKLLEKHDEHSDRVLDEAAAQLRAVIDKHDLHTPGVYHALGNAYMLSGDTGRAVLAYRKGEEIDPTDPALTESLEYARSLVPVRVTKNTPNRVWSWAMIWRGRIPRALLWWGFVACFTLGWVVLALRAVGRGSRGLVTAGVWMIGVSMLPLLMLGAEWARYQGASSAVVTQQGVIARTGPNDTIYEPAFADPLVSGVEGTVVETRDDWSRLMMADGTECWVPRSSIELVNP